MKKKKNHKKEIKDTLIFFGQWLLINIFFVFFLVLFIYIFTPDLATYIENSFYMGMNYEALNYLLNYTNDIDYRIFLQNATMNLTDDCSNDFCKVWRIIRFLKSNNDTIKENGGPEGIDCKEYSIATKILLDVNGIPNKMCKTKNHIFNIAYLEGNYWLVDTANDYVGEALIKEYILCKW